MLIIPILFEKFFGIIEKTLIGNAVVLQYNPLFDILKKPRYAGCGTLPASRIDVGKVFMDLAFPIDLVDDCSRRSASFLFTLHSCTWPVGDDKKMFGPQFPDLIKNNLLGLGPVEYDEKDRSVKLLH
ncbi:MAG TPA: hypothetical protein VMR99_02080 [Candidatus Paceibacterota bacterium]|nr:hypothetical protein [Candidatus Paceibacterota bacterium]